MMKLLVASMRNKLRTCRNAGPANPDEWEPVYEASPRRSLSAPSRWVCAVTDIGNSRSNNEDAFFVSADSNLWVVADGMGGHAAGEVASALTVQAIVESMRPSQPRADSDAGMCAADRLMTAFAIAQSWVCGHSRSDAGWRGMGSTAIAGAIDAETLHICHVGDVRAYHLSEGRFRRVTNDHSWVWQRLVMHGLLAADQVRHHPQRGQVTQAIGRPHGIKPELTSIALKACDRVLLCSDGLWEALTDEDIGKVVASVGSVRQLTTALVDRANAAGGQDNITAILYQHSRQRGARPRGPTLL